MSAPAESMLGVTIANDTARRTAARPRRRAWVGRRAGGARYRVPRRCRRKRTARLADLDRADAEPVGDRVPGGRDRHDARRHDHEHGRRNEQRPGAARVIGSDEPAAKRCGRVLPTWGSRGDSARSASARSRSITASPPRRARRAETSSARDSRDFAVPNGHANTSAVSLSLSPAKKRRATTSRWWSGRLVDCGDRDAGALRARSPGRRWMRRRAAVARVPAAPSTSDATSSAAGSAPRWRRS